MSANTVRDLFSTKAHNPSYSDVRAHLPNQQSPIDFCVPVNRYFPPPQLLEDIQRALPDIVKYYPDYADTHQQALSAIADVPMENIVVANGSTELITQLCQNAPAPLATSIPTFGQWTDLPKRNNREICFIQRQKSQGFNLSVEQVVAHVRQHKIKTLVLSNPNNPTGAAFTLGQIRQLVTELADLDTLVIDESFIDFADVESAAGLALSRKNLIVVKSLGKSLGWHGVRLGYAISNTERAEKLRSQLPYWNINGLAAFILQRVSHLKAELAQSFVAAKRDRQIFAAELSKIEALQVFPSQANFLYVELPASIAGQSLRNQLLTEYGLLIRECGNKIGSSSQFLRLSVNQAEQNQLLVMALQELTQQT